MPNYEGTKFCALPDDVLGARDGELCRWTKTEPLRYFFAEEWQNPPMADVKRAYRIAFDRWEKVCNIKFVEVESGQADISIYPRNLGGAGGVLAEAQLQCPAGNRPLWTRFDTSEDWIIADNPPSNKIDLIRVATHEIGHLMGIPHIGTGNLLAPTYSSRIKEPQVGDSAEAVARYGLPKPADAPDVPDTPSDPPLPGQSFVLIKIPSEWVLKDEDK
jgi:hypothetical protein